MRWAGVASTLGRVRARAARVTGEDFRNCFLAGTQVETERGRVAIEDVQVGDRVLARNEATGEQDWKPVVRLFRNTTDQVVTVHIAPVECMPLPRQTGRTERNSVGGSGEDGGGDADGEPPLAQAIRCTPGHP